MIRKRRRRGTSTSENGALKMSAAKTIKDRPPYGNT
jgi:hypothetical protein